MITPSVKIKTLCFLAVFLATWQAKGMEIVNDILYVEEPDLLQDAYVNQQCRLDLALPDSRDSFSTVVWFHGGGLTGGQKGFPNELLDQGFAVATVDYRLSPNVQASDCIEDTARAVAWVFRHIHEWGGSADKIILSGHSAGGYLVNMVTIDPRWLASFGIDCNKLAGCVPFSGHTITHFTVRKERGIPETQAIVDEMAPLYHVRSDCPPMRLITGDRDLELLGRYEENAYFWRMMKVVGNERIDIYELKGCDHGSMIAQGMPLLVDFVHSLEKNQKAEN